MTPGETLLALLIIASVTAAMRFALKAIWVNFLTYTRQRRERRRGERREGREGREIQRLGCRVDTFGKQREKVQRQIVWEMEKEERRQRPLTNYAEHVADESLYAPNLGNIGDPPPAPTDDVTDVYRGRR